MKLNDELVKCKEANNAKDLEIKRLRAQIDSTDAVHSDRQGNQPHKNEGWNKEVRILDARISDVLGKIKERELFLNNYDDWERRCKEYEKKCEVQGADLESMRDQLDEANFRISDLTSENDQLKSKLKRVLLEQQAQVDAKSQSNRKLSLHDFQDDLGELLGKPPPARTGLKVFSSKAKCS